jgi:hypothetical protein
MRKPAILLSLIVAAPFIVGPYITVAAANHPDAPPLASVTGSVGTASTGAQVSRLVSLIDSFVEQLSQVFMLRFFHVGTNC